MNYQDEFGITDRVTRIINTIPSWNRQFWTKRALIMAHNSNSIGEFTVDYNCHIEGYNAHMDLVEILELCCPGCYWATSESQENPDIIQVQVNFPVGSMEIPVKFRGGFF